MDWQSLFVLGLMLAMLVLLVSGRARVDAIGLGLMVAVVAAGIVPYERAVAGFGNKAILTIAGLYIVGEGLTQTGALEALGELLRRVARGSTPRLILVTCLAAAALSSLLNDTAVVVVMMPVVVALSGRADLPASRLLMPLAFASLLGGMNTLVGTSTNILVSGVAEVWGQAQIGMFELTPIGLAVCAAGIAYMVVGSRWLPRHASLTSLAAPGDAREYMTELVIGKTSPLVGRSYGEVRSRLHAEPLFFVRGEESIWPPYGAQAVRPGDVIMLQGGVEAIAEMQARLGLRYAAGPHGGPKERGFLEVALSPHSPLVGRRVEELRLWQDFGAVSVAILRDGQHLRQRLTRLHLRAGDLLLVAADEEAEARLRASGDFYVVGGGRAHVRPRRRRRAALAIAAAVIVLFTVTSVARVAWLPQPFIALLGALAMIAAGCVTPRRVYRTIDWPILIFIVGTLALGEAMAETGAVDLIAGAILGLVSRWGEIALVSGLVLLCVVLNSLIAHSAVAVLLTPIAIEAARDFATAQGLDAADPHARALLRACVLAIAYGGSLCFATPVGHQVNLMVMGPGAYRYGDYLRFGLPLSLIAWVVISFALPLRFGLI